MTPAGPSKEAARLGEQIRDSALNMHLDGGFAFENAVTALVALCQEPQAKPDGFLSARSAEMIRAMSPTGYGSVSFVRQAESSGDIPFYLGAAAPRQEGQWQTIGWVYEDELSESYPYDAMYAHSAIRDGVRMFPVFAPLPQPQEKPE